MADIDPSADNQPSKAEKRRRKRLAAAAERRARCISQCESLTNRAVKELEDPELLNGFFDELTQLAPRLLDTKLSSSELTAATGLFEAALALTDKCSRKQAHKLRQWNTSIRLVVTSSAVNQSCSDVVCAEVSEPQAKRKKLRQTGKLQLTVMSFGHKNAKPVSMDRVFDIRAVPPVKKGLKKDHTSCT